MNNKMFQPRLSELLKPSPPTPGQATSKDAPEWAAIASPSAPGSHRDSYHIESEIRAAFALETPPESLLSRINQAINEAAEPKTPDDHPSDNGQLSEKDD